MHRRGLDRGSGGGAASASVFGKKTRRRRPDGRAAAAGGHPRQRFPSPRARSRSAAHRSRSPARPSNGRAAPRSRRSACRRANLRRLAPSIGRMCTGLPVEAASVGHVGAVLGDQDVVGRSQEGEIGVGPFAVPDRRPAGCCSRCGHQPRAPRRACGARRSASSEPPAWPTASAISSAMATAWAGVRSRALDLPADQHRHARARAGRPAVGEAASARPQRARA